MATPATLTIMSLLKDSFYFFYKNSFKFIGLAIFISLLQIISAWYNADYLLALQAAIEQFINTYKQAMFSGEQLNLTQLSVELTNQLLQKISLSSIVWYFILELLLFQLLISGIFALSDQLLNYPYFEPNKMIYNTLTQLPKLIILFLFSLIIIVAGFRLFLVPGLIALYALTLSPIIMIVGQCGILQSIVDGFRLSFKSIFILLPFYLLFFLIKNFILILLYTFILPKISQVGLSVFIDYTFNNLIIAFFFIALIRFYLLYQQHQNNNNS